MSRPGKVLVLFGLAVLVLVILLALLIANTAGVLA